MTKKAESPVHVDSFNEDRQGSGKEEALWIALFLKKENSSFCFGTEFTTAHDLPGSDVLLVLHTLVI